MKLVHELWYILNRREKIEGFVLLCAIALGALFETISIGVVLPFIALLNDPDLIFKVSVTRTLFTYLGFTEPKQVLIAVGASLIVIFVIKSSYLVFLSRWQFRYIFATHVRLSAQLLSGYLNAPYTFHLQRNSAEMIKAMTETVQRFTTGFQLSLLSVLGEVLVVVAVTILLMLIDPLATLGAMLVLAVPTALMYYWMQHWLLFAGRQAETSFSAVLQWIDQAIGGIKETLVTGRAAFFIDQHGYHAQRMAEGMCLAAFISSIPRLVIDTLAVGAMVAIALMVLARGQDLHAILPVLTMFAVAAIRLMPSTSRIANGLAQMRFHYAATEVIYQELAKTQPFRNQRLFGDPLAPPFLFQRSITVDHLIYRYPSMPTPTVNDISFEIPRGHWIALVGATGAGKTTVLDMLLGLFVPTSGQIRVDGRDLQDDIAGWQRNIGFVPQNVYLMDDTIRRNVAFGLPDKEIDNERVWQVLQAAQVDGLVRSLSEGLDAVVGERGDRLSGGERQRLGIARALYHDPQVLVVDEGTAHLDNETEVSIGRVLSGLRGEKTIIMVAHRLALVRNCDRLYLLDQGRIRASGGYSELLSADPSFRESAGSAS